MRFLIYAARIDDEKIIMRYLFSRATKTKSLEKDKAGYLKLNNQLKTLTRVDWKNPHFDFHLRELDSWKEKKIREYGAYGGDTVLIYVDRGMKQWELLK